MGRSPSLWFLLGLAASCVPQLNRPTPGLDDLGIPPDVLPPLNDHFKPGSEVPSGSCATLDCDLGCDELLGRCRRLRAANLDAAPVFAAKVEALTLTGSAVTIDTDTGEIKDGATTIRASGSPGSVVSGVYWATVAQGGGGPEVALFGVKTLELKAAAVVTITGAKGFVLYATDSASIEGTLLAPAKGFAGGPGGFAGGENNGKPGAACKGGEGLGGGWGNGGTAGDGGGGGGGFKAAGGAGGDSSYPPSPGGGAGGTANGEASQVPLRGGCGGGAGGGPGQGPGGYGGGGGGAIQISVNGRFVVAGSISAPGGGGEGARDGAAGGGGGSGGAILLQAVQLEVSGVLAANGGGGGGGAPGPNQVGTSGQNGQAGATAATGGGPGTSHSGAGGAGAAGAEEGGKPGVKNSNGGGGGGSVGRIAIVAKTPKLSGVSSPTEVTVSQTVESF